MFDPVDLAISSARADAATPYIRQVEKLEEENARLRELVSDMWHYYISSHDWPMDSLTGLKQRLMDEGII